MKNQNYIENLIARFLNGESNDTERRELVDWINQTHQNKKDYLDLKDIWDITRSVKNHSDEQLVLFYKEQYERSKKSRIILLRRAVAIAAVLLIGLVITILIPNTTSKQSESLQVFSVPLGSRSKVLLADGTEINLNAGSELSYSSNFSSKNRNVTLTGEAYFYVKSDPVHPFIVKTKDFDIQVTGTKFNVCSYNEDTFSTTTLAEGKINLKFSNSDQLIDVKPGEKFLLDREARKYSLLVANVEQETSWKDGEFIFKNIPFPELVQRLERWYDVKLTVSDEKLTNYTYTGRFKNQETIWQVLDALKLTSPIDYKKTTFREFEITYKPMSN
jgi:transmembrane sensor